ncbi:MAG TPA: peptidylprolyl isomerase, partial [Leptospiraceae bacterium]|nr:peptidylprolyl isomerase [Leptospiraceae bacterium]
PDLPLEVSPLQKNTRGSLAMARTQNPNSANSQFYIVLKDAPHLNMQYTVFGRVLENGMDVVDKIKMGDAIIKMEEIKG